MQKYAFLLIHILSFREVLIMSSTKIKLIGLLILMGSVTDDAVTTNTYKKPDGAKILTNREFD